MEGVGQAKGERKQKGTKGQASGRALSKSCQSLHCDPFGHCVAYTPCVHTYTDELPRGAVGSDRSSGVSS